MKRIRKKTTKRIDRSKVNQVFVSHATVDKWVAKMMCERLENAGVKTFRDDRDLNGGDDIPDSIRIEIKRSRELVVLMTPRSIHRPWVLLEVGAFWGWSRNVRITAILYHVEIDSIPDIIKTKKAYDLNDFDLFVSEVSRRIGRKS